MSYRDWGRGEGNPRERQPIAPWDDPGESLPDPYASGTERYRTPSRRRAIERGQQEPIDAYLPRWAVESGIETADGGGRHAAPDDEDDRPRSCGGWPAAESVDGRRRESGWRETPVVGAAPASEHTSEWTIDRPHEQGYVGSRRADSSEDDPVSGVVPQVRPRRSPSRRPEVIWSGGEESATQPEESDRGDTGRPTRRNRRATADSWPQPATDPPDRGAERPADPWDRSAERPADPWDSTAERPADPWDR
ncbi:hypothetical protein JNW88_22345, partial [Micromonospora sp. ATA32]|nr:hypothetical protein [Micromonospora sp. ATA32]